MSRKLRAVTVLGEKMTQRSMKSGKSDENQKSCDTNRAKSDTALFFLCPLRWKTKKKRHPRKDVSIYGVEQGGTVEKPWPPVAS